MRGLLGIGRATLGDPCRSSHLTLIPLPMSCRLANDHAQGAGGLVRADGPPEPHRQLVVEQQLEALPLVLLAALVQLVRLLQEGQHVLRARGASSIQGSGRRA